MAEIKNKRKTLSLNRETNIEKKASEELAISRIPVGEMGYLGLAQIAGYIYEQSKAELRGQEAIKTFKKMSMDPVIAAANNVISLMINKVDAYFKAPKDATKDVIEAVAFLNYCKENMVTQTWSEFINDAGSYRIFGFSLHEKVFTKVTTGKWTGKYKWKRLPSRAQTTVSKWIYDDTSRDLIGFEQMPSMSGVQQPATSQTTITIPRKKFMHFRYDPKRDNPEGNSPLLGAWVSWKYKQVFEELEGIGLAKDMSGVPRIGIDVNYLAKAIANPDGPEAKTIQEMKSNAANFSKGDQSYVIYPLAYDANGKELFKFDVIGVDGAGKKDSIDVGIKRKQTEILMVYLADVLQLGNSSHGSYSLADAKTNLLGHAIQYHLKLLADVINKDLIPQTLAINGWNFSEEMMPYIEFDDPESVNLDELSKFIQRLAAVGQLPQDKSFINEVMDLAGFDYRVPVDISDEEFKAMFPNNQSKSGKGMESGLNNGTGSSLGTSGDADTSNSES